MLFLEENTLRKQIKILFLEKDNLVTCVWAKAAALFWNSNNNKQYGKTSGKERERDVKPNQFKLQTDKTYREVDTKKQTTLELFFSCYHVPKKTDILNLESKVKRNNEKNKKWWIKIADVKLKHTHTEPIFWRWKKRVKKLSKVKFTKNTKHIFTLLLLKQQILIYYRNYSHY